MRLTSRCFNAGWLRVFSLLVPVGPPLGFGTRDERAWEEVVQRLS
jgi:hypothetical protein